MRRPRPALRGVSLPGPIRRGAAGPGPRSGSCPRARSPRGEGVRRSPTPPPSHPSHLPSWPGRSPTSCLYPALSSLRNSPAWLAPDSKACGKRTPAPPPPACRWLCYCPAAEHECHVRSRVRGPPCPFPSLPCLLAILTPPPPAPLSVEPLLGLRPCGLSWAHEVDAAYQYALLGLLRRQRLKSDNGCCVQDARLLPWGEERRQGPSRPQPRPQFRSARPSLCHHLHPSLALLPPPRSEERRVGKECRSRWSPYH